jgi:phospholipid/cholesterol/gamma-HCH transport system substrate-binding protein
MSTNVIETITGAVVLAVAAGFLAFGYQGSQMNVNRAEGYTVKAKFTNATGINIGSDVRVGGIKIGSVADMLLDPQTYQAVALLHIAKKTQIPTDSSAAIASSGLLGDKFLQITPGGEDKMLAEGGEIRFTQSSVSLEELIGKYVFSGGGVDKGGSAKPETAAPPDATPATPAPAAAQ